MKSACVSSALCLLSALAALSQQPVINPEGVVNAASLALHPQFGAVVVPGAIVSLFGQNLAASAQAAAATPLPTSLAGTSVTVGGIPAPLFYVSPGQINLQVPRRTNLYAQLVPVVVTTGAGSSAPVLVTVMLDAPGIFTQGSRGCGQGAVLNVAADGSVTLNTPTNSVSPGSYVSIYGTGLGPANFPPEDGQPATWDPVSYLQGTLLPTLGLEGFERTVPPGAALAWRAPGLVGVDQLNLKMPDDAPEGCAVPLKLRGHTSTSQPVLISIRRGGGQCQDAAEARFATLRWQRTITSGPQPASFSLQEMFTASFGAGPENLVVPLPDPVPRVGYYSDLYPRPGPRCLNAAPRTLDAGALTLQGFAGAPLTVLPVPISGEIVYAATLPGGSIQGGTLRVAAAGGADVGAFEAAVSIPPPIKITTPLAGGTVIRNTQPFRLTWTHGTPDAVVRILLTAMLGQGGTIGHTVLASDGEITIGLIDVGGGALIFPLPPNDDTELVVTASPRAGQVQTFAAPGLTRDGRHEWVYEYRFRGLKIGPGTSP
jgi:uncharacterized protein (TIGR03437 family)